jgi:uncharacterized protein (TIGR00730 family)
MAELKRLCVFCGSSSGRNPVFAAAARELGALLAATGIELVYGGGNVGLMGELARAVLASGGRVIGVIPRELARQVSHAEISELILVDGMHERKQRMHQLSDGFVALPGGIGTLEELVEAFTWAQLGLHAKPVALLDTAGFYRELQDFLAKMVETGFLRREHFDSLIIGDDARTVLDRMRSHIPRYLPKWHAPA